MNHYINLKFTKATMLVAVAGLSLTACSQLVEVDIPKNQLTGEAVFADSIAATSALANIYVTYEQYIPVTNLALYTDELVYPQSSEMILEYYQSRVSPDNGTNRNYWSRLYNMIYQCNAIIEQENIVSLRLQAEARFLRAHTYLMLQSLYGNIPLILVTEVSVSSRAPQVPEEEVYRQVIADLEWARDHLAEPGTGVDNLRANRMAATALLARAFLYAGRWEEASQYATEVIQSPFYRLETPKDVFTAGSGETIFQIASQNGVVTGVSSLVPADLTAVPSYPLANGLVNTFEAGDARRQAWIGTSNVFSIDGIIAYHYSAKYRNRVAGEGAGPEHLICIRLGEMYLIRAEARARMEDTGGAFEDVNALRVRANIDPVGDPLDSGSSLATVLEERRRELFLEGGHRLFDLRRFGLLDAVIGALKPSWESAGVFFPIPLDELRYNKNLNQNKDY